MLYKLLHDRFKINEFGTGGKVEGEKGFREVGDHLLQEEDNLSPDLKLKLIEEKTSWMLILLVMTISSKQRFTSAKRQRKREMQDVVVSNVVWTKRAMV